MNLVINHQGNKQQQTPHPTTQVKPKHHIAGLRLDSGRHSTARVTEMSQIFQNGSVNEICSLLCTGHLELISTDLNFNYWYVIFNTCH